MATVKDIAQQAGVSIATVSRVLNNQGGYSEETRKKVAGVARAMNYYRNEMAAGLKKSVTHIIGLIVPTALTLFYGDIIEGIEQGAQGYGYGVIISHAGLGGKNLDATLSLMAERRVDGLVIASLPLTKAQVQRVQAFDFPVIMVSSYATPAIPYLKVDDYSAAFDATNFLIEKGYRRIAMAGPDPADLIAGKPRIAGFLAAMQQAGLPAAPGWLAYGNFSFEAGVAAMQGFWQQAAKPEAVVAVSDDVALGVVNACSALHLSVPDDVAVIGYDDTRVARMANPPLTAISQPFLAMGEKAADKLIQACENGTPITSEILPHRIVVRATT